MTKLERLILNCPGYDRKSGFAELVSAARQEQAELVAALREARKFIADEWDNLPDSGGGKCLSALDALLARFPAS